MDNPVNWSFGIGRVWGIRIRVHLLFIVAVVFLLSPSLHATAENQVTMPLSDRFAMVALLFALVLLHEFGHCFGARRTGGQADEILLGPLGGLAMVRPPDTPRAHMITLVAGPAVNLLLLVVAAVVLAATYGGITAVPWNPFDPFYPVNGQAGFHSTMHWWLCVFFGINYLLLLFNLLPIYPMDGGRMVYTYLWPRRGRRRATLIATSTGMIGSIVVGLTGIVSGDYWLVMLAVYFYFTCFHDRQVARTEMDEVLGECGYDFSQGYISLDTESPSPPKPGYFQRRRERKQRLRAEREKLKREQLARRVDKILHKISADGMDSLTSEERTILREATEHQRSAADT